MDSTGTNATPWHLWAVGVLALCFTAFGGYDYYMSQIGDRDYIAGAVEPLGMDADVAVEYFASFPLWMDFVWAVGVWGGVLGALLLLFRSSYAYPIWLTSLAAFVVSNAYGFANPMPGVADPSMTYVMVGTVFVVMVLLTLYARAMKKRGVLR